MKANLFCDGDGEYTLCIYYNKPEKHYFHNFKHESGYIKEHDCGIELYFDFGGNVFHQMLRTKRLGSRGFYYSFDVMSGMRDMSSADWGV